MSDVAVWIESAWPPYRCVLCLACVEVRRAAQCDRRTHSDAERTCRADSVHTATTDTTQTGLSCRVWRAVWVAHDSRLPQTDPRDALLPPAVLNMLSVISCWRSSVELSQLFAKFFPVRSLGQSSGGNYLYFRSYLNNHSVLVERSVYAKISWICSTVLTQYRLVRETPMRNYYRASIESRGFLPAVIAHAVTE